MNKVRILILEKTQNKNGLIQFLDPEKFEIASAPPNSEMAKTIYLQFRPDLTLLEFRRPKQKHIIPQIAVGRELELKRLVTLPWSENNIEVAQLMIWHKAKWLSPIMKGFMDTAREVLKNF